MIRAARVVGAGVSGLSASILLARRGIEVELVTRAEVGGLAGSRAFRGVACDLGSHRLHADALRVPLLRELAGAVRLIERPRRGVLVLGDARVPYPLRPASMLRALGPLAAIGMGAGFVRARLAGGARFDDARLAGDDVGYADFVRARVGEAAYARFYAPYAEKVWGVDPATLSQSVAKLRVSSSSPTESLRAPTTSYLYPEEGFAEVTRWLARAAREAGVWIREGVAFDRARHLGDVDAVLHAGALRDLVPTTLAHRGVYLVYLALRGAPEHPAETWYVPDARYWFGRVAVLNHYAPRRVAHDETLLCVEVPEGRWGEGVDFTAPKRLEALLAQLRAAGVVSRAQRLVAVEASFARDVYPLYLRGWRARLDAALAAVPEGVFPFGRQGLFLHCNTDHCVEIAHALDAHLAAGGGARAWIDRAEAFRALRVRD